MSGSKFWAKNQDRRPESQKAGGPLAGTLTATDRCDARAHGVLLPGRRELLFCAHHNRQYATALTTIAVEIRDETDRPGRVAAQPDPVPASVHARRFSAAGRRAVQAAAANLHSRTEAHEVAQAALDFIKRFH